MGLCGCCSGKVAGEAPAPRDFFFKRRGCTDILCLLIFIGFWGGMGYISYLSVTVGDPNAVLYGSDYLGNRCGIGSMKDKPKVYFPRMDKDIIAQAPIATTTPWRLALYGLCVEECPNVQDPEMCFDDPSQCIVNDYGAPSEYGPAGGSAYYYATMPSLTLLNRCVPTSKEELTQEDDRCAFPQCDGVEYAPCDEEYPTTWKMSFPESLKCDVKFQVGEVKKLATTSDGVMTGAIADKVAAVQRFIDSLVASHVEILTFGLAVPIVMGFVWLVLLRFFAKTFTYAMIFGIGFAMLVLTLYLYVLAGAAEELLKMLAGNSNSTLAVSNASGVDELAAESAAAVALGLDNLQTSIAASTPSALTDAINEAENSNPALWWVLAVLMSIVTLLYVISMCAARKQIKVAVAIVKEGSVVIKHRPATMFFPFGTLVFQAGLGVYFILILLFLGTADLDSSHFSEIGAAVTTASTYLDKISFYNDTIASGGAEAFEDMDSSQQYVQAVVYIYFLFGFLWTLESIKNISWTAMSGSVCHWYWFRPEHGEAKSSFAKTRAPLLRSLGRVFRYHLGSIFFGSFIIAVIQLIRILLMALDRYTKKLQDRNMLVKLLIKCTQCCMWCLEKTMKFITDYCYIYVAMQGTGFCRSCWATFSLIMKNMAQLSINTFVRTILSWIQLLGLPVACGFLGNLVCEAQGRAEVVWPTVVIALMALIIAKVYTTVFSCVLDTLFVCCARDKEDYQGEYMPDRLRDAFGFGKKLPQGDDEGDELKGK